MKRPWTTHELETLRALYGKVHPGEIGRRLGRTPGAVRGAAYKAGVTFDRRAEFGPAFGRFLRQKHAEGWHDTDIAAAWGCCVDAVAKWRKDRGLPSNFNNARHWEKWRESTGESHIGLVRWSNERITMMARGWGAVSKCEADILDALVNGPMKSPDLRAVLGYKANNRIWERLKRLAQAGKIVRGQGRGVWMLAPNVKRHRPVVLEDAA